MTTVIDSLVVTLGLDPKQFNKEQKQSLKELRTFETAAKKSTTEISLGAKVMVSAFRSVKTEILGMTAAIVGFNAIKNFIGDVTRLDASTGRTAARLNVTTEALSTYQGVLRKFGSTNDEVADSFRRVESLFQAGKWGEISSEQILALSQLHINVGEFLRQDIDDTQRIKMLQEGVSSVSAQDAQLWAEKLGFAENFVTALRESNSQMSGLLEKQLKSNSISKEDARLAAVRQRAWDNAVDSLYSFGRGILNAFTVDSLGNSQRRGARHSAGAASAPGTSFRPRSGPSSGSSGTRGGRNNNPGNLNFAGQRGATLESGPGARFAKFGTPEEGIAALSRQLQLYGERNIDTIQAIISKYAPASDNNNTAAYIAVVMKKLGVSADAHLNLNDAATMQKLVSAIVAHESPGAVNAGQINAGLSLSRRSRSGTIAPAANVTIQRIDVHTQATDAAGIARSIAPELKHYTQAAQVNTGLN